MISPSIQHHIKTPKLRLDSIFERTGDAASPDSLQQAAATSLFAVALRHGVKAGGASPPPRHVSPPPEAFLGVTPIRPGSHTSQSPEPGDKSDTPDTPDGPGPAVQRPSPFRSMGRAMSLDVGPLRTPAPPASYRLAGTGRSPSPLSRLRNSVPSEAAQMDESGGLWSSTVVHDTAISMSIAREATPGRRGRSSSVLRAPTGTSPCSACSKVGRTARRPQHVLIVAVRCAGYSEVEESDADMPSFSFRAPTGLTDEDSSDSEVTRGAAPDRG